MTNVPISWAIAPIVDVLVLNENGKPFQQGWSPQCENHPASHETWGVLKTTAIQPGQFWDHENKQLPENLDPRPQIEVRAGDLLLTCAGPRARCGVVCLVEHTRPMLMMSGKMYRFRPNTEVMDPRFLAYFIQSRSAQITIDAMKTGINDSGLNLTHDRFATLAVPVAPPLEQRRIVAKIEELFSELDKGVENVATARAKLKSFRHSILKHAFDGKPAQRKGNSSWPKRPLGELLEFLTSGSRGWADYYSDNGDIFIRAQNLKHDRLDLSDVAFVRLPEGNTEGIRTQVRLGDVLITITGANVTKTGYVYKDLGMAYVSQHVALCRPTENLLPEYLYWYLLSEAGGRAQLNEAAYGAGKPGLNLDNIRNVTIPVPPLTRQRDVVSLIIGALDPAERFESDIANSFGRLEALRQSIFQQAFSGKLTLQDATDESASDLLERIRSEHVESSTKKRDNIKTGKKEAA